MSIASALAARRARAVVPEHPAPGAPPGAPPPSSSLDPRERVTNGSGTTVGVSGEALDRPLRGSAIAVVDVETTSADPTEARIVEIAVVVVEELGVTEPVVVLHERVNPGVPIPDAAARIHGISDADVADARPWLEVWTDVHRAIGGRIPAAFNCAYDARVIGYELARLGVESDGLDLGWRTCLEFGGIPWGTWLDPFVIGKLVDKFEKGKKLAQIAARRGLVVDAHGAAGDAVTTAILIPALLAEAVDIVDRRGRPIEGRPTRGLTVRGYLEWQRTAALAQERELVEFSDAAVECSWHLLERLELPVKPGRKVRGTAVCESCKAPIVWAVTKAGKRMPLDPAEIRASENGPGRVLALVVGGAVRTRLREDPNGTVIGREAHFYTCPNAEQHRQRGEKPKAANPAPIQAEIDRGARIRMRRADGLGLTAGWAATSCGIASPVWMRAEDGNCPDIGWERLEETLLVLLEERIRQEIRVGNRWEELVLPGWSAAEIRAAAESIP